MLFEKDTLDIDFHKASEEVKILSVKPTDKELLNLYGLYKQATIGSCKLDKPSLFSFKEYSKWNAWFDQYGKSKSKAKREYIDLVETLKTKYNR